MNDIDTALRRLAEAETPPRLLLVDAAVFRRIDGRSPGVRDAYGPVRVAVVAAALVMGITAGLLPGQSADAKDAYVEISGAAKLAPSTLLVGGR